MEKIFLKANVKFTPAKSLKRVLSRKLIPAKSLVSLNSRKLIPAKSSVKPNSRKLIPAKCPKKKFAKINSRENFFPQVLNLHVNGRPLNLWPLVFYPTDFSLSYGQNPLAFTTCSFFSYKQASKKLCCGNSRAVIERSVEAQCVPILQRVQSLATYNIYDTLTNKFR